MSRQQLLDSKPKRKDFKTDEDFEEAHGYWMSHQGRILSMTQKPEYREPSETEIAIHDQVSEWFTKRFASPVNEPDSKP